MDIIGPNDLAYVIALFKNSKEMWDQDIKMQEFGAKTTDVSPEKKLSIHKWRWSDANTRHESME
jgi:hypothetical protein